MACSASDNTTSNTAGNQDITASITNTATPTNNQLIEFPKVLDIRIVGVDIKNAYPPYRTLHQIPGICNTINNSPVRILNNKTSSQSLNQRPISRFDRQRGYGLASMIRPPRSVTG